MIFRIAFLLAAVKLVSREGKWWAQSCQEFGNKTLHGTVNTPDTLIATVFTGRDSGDIIGCPPPPAVTHGEVAMSPTNRATPELRHLIAVRAYQLWENRGRPNGYDQMDWHAAEQEIMSSLETVAPHQTEEDHRANNL
jgi:hypothetical protein